MLRTSRRLQWRMTYSYILVTIPALIIMQAGFLAIIGWAFAAFLNSQLLAEEQAKALGVVAPQAARFMGGPSPDRDGLGQWLRGTMCSNGSQPSLFPPDSYPPVEFTAITDASGKVLVDGMDMVAAGMLLPELLDPHGARVLEAALAGQTSPQALALRQPDDGLVAASPIMNSRQQVIGAWFVNIAATPLPTRNESLWVLLFFLVPLSLLASCFAVGLGAVYGRLTSRNLVRRLRGLSLAADAWSAGDFGVLARDSSQDELGHLSRRLNQMAEKLRALVSTRQELATLEERNRLARDLHDSVKQQLFAVSMQLASARTLVHGQAAVDRLLARAESLTQAAQREVTATIHALRPATLSAGGIEPALHALVTEWSRQHAIPARLDTSVDAELPPPVEQALFRVTQEALANVARHSGASCVTLELVTEPAAYVDNLPHADTPPPEPPAIRLSIADDGRGFARSAHGQGFGLQSMRERVVSCGGTLEVDSRPGAGTRVSARFPLQEHAHA